MKALITLGYIDLHSQSIRMASLWLFRKRSVCVSMFMMGGIPSNIKGNSSQRFVQTSPMNYLYLLRCGNSRFNSFKISPISSHGVPWCSHETRHNTMTAATLGAGAIEAMTMEAAKSLEALQQAPRERVGKPLRLAEEFIDLALGLVRCRRSSWCTLLNHHG